MKKLEERKKETIYSIKRNINIIEAEVNFEKTKFQIFLMSNSTETLKLKIEIFDLLETTNQVYLGMLLDRRLTFKDHANQ